MKKKSVVVLGTIVLVLLLASGCGLMQFSSEKLSDLDYTVLDTDGIPEELLAEIESQKENAFTLTYLDGDYLYLARGFGEQETGGYSISVTDLYLTENSICFETTLVGPKKGETVSTAVTYPYIVVKLERREEPVVFD